MRRYRESELADPVFERLLGVEMKREQYRRGRTFGDAVVELGDPPRVDVGLGRGAAVAPRDRGATTLTDSARHQAQS